MKTYRPARLRGLTEAAGWFTVMMLAGGVLAGFIVLARTLDSHEKHRMDADTTRVLALSVGGLFGLFGLLGAAGSLGIPASRYEAGPTELVIRKGWIFRTTDSIPYVEVTRVERASGPLMRLCGIEDLKLCVSGRGPFVTLYGIAGAGELRQYILDRRDALHEAVLEGEYSVAKTPQDMMFERLDRVLERVERHLPPKIT
jgi:hypothetical protein